MLSYSPYSVINGGIILFGYIVQNGTLQYYFYCQRRKDTTSWKTQPENNQHVGRFWFLPLFSKKPERAFGHSYITTFNLLMATAFAFIVSELCIRGHSKMVFEAVPWGRIALDLLIAYIYENVAEYYWHRMLHLPPLYKRFHKYHHAYKDPEPFDDMYIHPLEAFCYYCILYAPPFLFSCHVFAFIGYMIIMGLAGTLDHSGIRIHVPGIYDASDHDRHHSKFNVNYAFPSPYLDIIHGTYDGIFLGIVITPRNATKKQLWDDSMINYTGDKHR